MRERGFVPIFLGVLIIIFAAGGLIYFTKSLYRTKSNPDSLSIKKSDINTDQSKNAQIDTSNWKTFNNTEYFYSLKYPPGWGPGINGPVDPSISDAAVIKSKDTCIAKDDLCAIILILPDDNQGKPNFRSPFFYYVDNPPAPEGDKVFERSNLTIDGEDAITFNYFEKNLEGSGGLNGVVIMNHKNLQYTIKYIEGKYDGGLVTDKSQWKGYKYFETIISTFKFTN